MGGGSPGPEEPYDTYQSIFRDRDRGENTGEYREDWCDVGHSNISIYRICSNARGGTWKAIQYTSADLRDSEGVPDDLGSSVLLLCPHSGDVRRTTLYQSVERGGSTSPALIHY